MIKVCYHFKVKKCLVVLLDLTNTRCAQMCDDDEQCNALPTKIAIFQTITHHRTPPILSIFSIPQYIHTQPAFLSHSIIEVVLKVNSSQFVTSFISTISDLFTTGSRRQRNLHEEYDTTWVVTGITLFSWFLPDLEYSSNRLDTATTSTLTSSLSSPRAKI